MNPDFEKVKSLIALLRRILFTLCALVIAGGALILVRCAVNADYLRNYKNGRFSTIPEVLLLYLPFGENYVAPYNLGNAEYQRGNYEKAVDYYFQALSADTPEHPAREEECRIRVNLALSLCHTIDFDHLSDPESLQNAINTLLLARYALTEEGCASEPVGSSDGHFADADKLRRDIDEMLQQLQAQSDSRQNDGNGGSGGGGDDQKDDGGGQGEDQQDSSKSKQQKSEEEKMERARQEKLKEDLAQQKEDLKDTHGSSSSYNYEYIDGGDAKGYGEGTLW